MSRTSQQALADVAALCNEAEELSSSTQGAVAKRVTTKALRAILADVEPEPAVVWDRDAARDLIVSYWKAPPRQWDEMLDALEGCVRPAPAQNVEERDWVGNPDGTLVYWQHEAEAARAKAAAIEQKFRRWVGEAAAPVQTIDRETLTIAINVAAAGGSVPVYPEDVQRYVEAVLAVLRPGPAHTIDRDALVKLLDEDANLNWQGTAADLADRVLALLRPVDGVILTREEALRARAWLDDLADHDCPSTSEDRALAARLEAAP